MELAKTYDPSAVEPETYRTWLEENCFTADPGRPGDAYSIVIPPPNVTGALHLGHAINNTLQDILTRKSRMEGKNTLWVPGIDHAGIATQAVVEKQLKEKENKTRHDVGREGLVARIWEWKQQYGDRILMQLQRMGCSCDWSRTRFTLDEMCARAVRETFFKLFKDGLIYRGKRLVNWDTHLQTSISDDELYVETVKTSLWHIKYPIEGTDKAMTIATTRPETMLADTAVAVHPDDPRWNWAIGKQVRLPLTNRLIPIVADPVLVDMTFGSGAVKVTPAHDAADYGVWQRQNGAIEILNLMTPDGKVSDDARWAKYAGLTLPKARKQVVEDLLAQGFMSEADIKPHEANVNFSDRSKTAIEPYLSDQWFVKMAPLAEPALQVVRDGTIKFFPERHAQQYLSWLGEKRDWPISRQLWWGHRIPVWSYVVEGIQYEQTGNLAADGEPDFRATLTDADERAWTAAKELKTKYPAEIWFRDEYPGVRPEIFDLGPDQTPPESLDVCLNTDNPELAKALEAAGFVQDPDVLDTWFSSALWPHSTLGWPDDTADLRKWYPTSVLLTGRDIITLWVARMVMTGIYNMSDHPSYRGTGLQPVGSEHGLQARATEKPAVAIPFHHVAINPTILDGKGERMSKSKGNGVDPVDIIETHGADALRFTLTTMATETQDARLPVKKLPDGRNTSEKFDLGRNFCNKVWNAARFVLTNLEPSRVGLAPPGAGGGASPTLQEAVDEQKWTMADRWIVSRFNRAVEESNAAIAAYRFDVYARACYDFFWRDFCDWYLEIVKGDFKNPDRVAQVSHVLAGVLDGALRLMHPVIPFITEKLWWSLNEVRPQRGLPGRIESAASKRLIAARWPSVGSFSEAAEFIFPRLQEIVVAIRNVRNEYKVDPRKPVTVSISAPGDSARQIEANRNVIELLALCALREVRSDLPAPQNASRASAAGCEIFIEGLIDPEAEKQRSAKRREELTKKQAALKGRLGNESYISKAPPQLVKQTQDELAEVEAELAKLG